MIHFSTPDRIDFGFGIFWMVVLWLLFILIVLIQRRRAKVRSQRKLRIQRAALQRERMIEAMVARDKKLEEDLIADKAREKRDRR